MAKTKKWITKRRKDREAQREYIEKHPFCEVCGRLATEVHEIIFRSQGGKCEENNEISLCRECHLRCHGVIQPRISREELYEIKRKNGG